MSGNGKKNQRGTAPEADATLPVSPMHMLSNPQTAALVSKSTTDPRPKPGGIQTRGDTFNINATNMLQIANTISQNRRDGENILQLFPDIELAMQVLVSSTLSPKDMKAVTVIYGNEDNEDLPSDVLAKLTDIVKTEIEKHYHLSEDQDRILREAMFEVGAHVRVIIPESSLDDMIHGRDFDTKKLSISFESDDAGNPNLRRSKGLGILGSTQTLTGNSTQEAKSVLERLLGQAPEQHQYTDNRLVGMVGKEYVVDDLIEFTDNFDVLKLPEISRVAVEQQLRKVLRANSRVKVAQEATLARRGNADTTNMAIGRNRRDTSRLSIGRPLAIEPPPESIMVIHTPGRPSEHQAYIMLTDIEGNPLSMNGNMPLHGSTAAGALDAAGGQLQSANMGPGAMGSNILQKAREQLRGTDNDSPVSPELINLYGKIIQDNIARRINAGLTGGEIEVSEQNEFYRLMFARSLAGRFTRMVFLPKELVTYYAFKFYDNGVGRSYFDNVRVLATHRAALLYSDVIGHVKSSIPITNVRLKLGEDDPDINKTIAQTLDEIMRVRNDVLPKSLSPAELQSWTTRQGVEITFEDHPALPDTRLEFETKRLERQQSDTTLNDELRKQMLMAFGVNPDQVDSAQQIEFATSLQQSSLMFAKHTARIGAKQSLLNTQYVKSIVDNDMIIQTKLRKVIKENLAMIREHQGKSRDSNPDAALPEDVFVEDMLASFIDSIKLSLPQADSSSVAVLKELFEEQKTAYEAAIETFLSSDMITEELLGEVAGQVELFQKTMLNTLLRKWMADNGYLPEVAELFLTDENDKITTDNLAQSARHLKTVSVMVLEYIESLRAMKDAIGKDADALGIDGGGDSTTDDTSGDDMGGTDEFGEGGDGEPGDAALVGDGGAPDLDDPSLDDPDAKPDDESEANGEGNAEDEGNDFDLDKP